ncbi:MAG: DUF4446 family protein [Phascolarctobacterium sp.]|uniref:DUF4446 family protein n=1 Tax=Phascolarctobacterium sp. TaxID=2049039 RepID=UPI0026DD8476|nr:DUF4446 family protein [Phascolarctobacterium sp.]MDO4922156.1 DUF4446 family protein [Phascolarctobacterium sp.]
MEEVNLLLSDNLAVIVAALFLIIIALVIWLCSLKNKLSALQAKYDFFTQGKEANIDTVLTDTLSELRQTRQELQELQSRHGKLHEQVQGCLQTVKLTRYDAFDAMGGEMSYSILLADAKKNGVILTSIYGRDESRCYAKNVQDGKSAYPLAEEEKNLL